MATKSARQKKARERLLTGNVKSLTKEGKDGLTEQQKIAQEAVHNLEKLGGVLTRDEDIIFKGKQLIVPASMSLEQLVAFAQIKIEEEEVVTDFTKVFKYRPLDVAYCTWQAMMKAFGSVAHQSRTVQTFFGPQKMPPQLVDVPINAHETMQVPWGNFEIPYLPGVLFELDRYNDQEFGTCGYITATGSKKWRYAVHGVFELIERELKNNSVYRGKAFDGREDPQFLDLTKHDTTKMVFSEQIRTQLDASLWGAIRHRERLARVGIPFKRAILLSGGFGVGKSISINETGRICQEEGVTFILVRPGRDRLADAMMTARIYQPAVVAFEDVDTLADAESDAKRISEVLDLFDGIEAKNTDIMLVLTTNHQEKLHKGMLRPGRLDAVVEIGPPDAEGIQKLIEVNIGPALHHNINWDAVTASGEGYLPAFVVEASHRAVRYNLIRNQGNLTDITTDDLVGSLEGLRPQWRLMEDAKTEVVPPTLDKVLESRVREEVAIGTERLAQAFGSTVGDLDEFITNRNRG